MNKNKTIKICLLSLLILLIGIITFITIKKDKKEEKNQVIDTGIKGNTNMFIVGNASEHTLSTKQIIKKIEFSVKNDTTDDISMGVYLFHLADANKNELGLCYTRSMDDNYETDYFPDIAAANTTTNGYLYCNTVDDTTEKYLKISYPTKAYLDESKNVTFDTTDIYIEIK